MVRVDTLEDLERIYNNLSLTKRYLRKSIELITEFQKELEGQIPQMGRIPSKDSRESSSGAVKLNN